MPEILNFFTFFRSSLSISVCIHKFNLNSSSSFRIHGYFALRLDYTHSQSESLLPDDSHDSGSVIIFVRQHLSFSELSLLSFSSLDPCSNYVGVNISLKNFFPLSFLNIYSPPSCSSCADSRIVSSSPFVLLSSRNLFNLRYFNCHHRIYGSKSILEFSEKEVFDWVISSDLLPFNDPGAPTLHLSFVICFSSNNPFAPLSLALLLLLRVALGFRL